MNVYVSWFIFAKQMVEMQLYISHGSPAVAELHTHDSHPTCNNPGSYYTIICMGIGFTVQDDCTWCSQIYSYFRSHKKTVAAHPYAAQDAAPLIHMSGPLIYMQGHMDSKVLFFVL